MKNSIVLVLACILFAGCTSAGKTFELPADYAPLKYLKNRSQMPGLGLVIRSKNIITTIGDSAYVKDVDEYLKTRPVGGRHFHAIMTHEQTHSRRQIATGTKKWILRYLSDAKFAWAEEQIGWYHELKLLRAGGLMINVDGVAKTLAGYLIPVGRIVSEDDARAWVNDVLAGRWEPGN